MKIIAWDKETDKAITPERSPVNGEWALFDNGKIKTKKQYNDLVTPSIKPIREISAYAFRRRFTKLERKNIRKSQVDDIQDVKESLEYASIVRLDHPFLIADIDVLVSNGIIDTTRKAELLADGLEAESIH